MNESEVLLDILRGQQGKGEDYFNSSTMNICYKTGIAPLDYALGYMVYVYDKKGEVIEEYPALGITCGTNLMIIGKSGTAKSSILAQIAGAILRPFENGLLIDMDMEQAMTISRLKTMTRFTIDEMKHKVLLRQGDTTLEGAKKIITKVWKEKRDNPDKYMYNTGKRNEFGEPIVLYQPTIIMLDSIAAMTVGLNPNDKSDYKKIEEVTSQMDRMRVTGEIGRFYTDLLPMLKEVNMIPMSVNHIKVNPQVGVVKEPAELLYLKQNEALPGGKTPPYLAHILLKSVAIGSEKFTEEEDGFDGFGIWLEIIKSRSNQAGQKVHLIYDKFIGIDPVRSNLAYAKDIGVLAGNKNKSYFIEAPEHKFSMREVNEYFAENREMYRIMYDHILPSLRKKLSTVSLNTPVHPELMDY